MATSFKRRLPKLALGLLAAIIMVLGLAPGVGLEKALAKDAADGPLLGGGAKVTDTQYPLWVGGTQVTSKNLKGKGWSFNPTTKTLTLDGYSYKGTGYVEEEQDGNGHVSYNHSPIFWNDSESALIIELKGKNSVAIAGGPEHAKGVDGFYGVFSAGGLTFKGTGSLIANARDIEQPGKSSKAAIPRAAGIHADRNITIEGGSITAAGYDSGIDIHASGRYVMTVKGGSVQAIGSGDKAFGISAQNSSRGSIVIEKGIVSFVASGASGGIGKNAIVKNAVAGIGWTNAQGTKGKSVIKVNTSGQILTAYKKVQFLGAAKKPTTPEDPGAAKASVTTPPSGKSLTYNGKPQELVTAGTAYGGTMQYSLDGKTFSTTIPTATNVDKYTVYYKVVGDKSHADSDVKTVTAEITGNSTPAGPSVVPSKDTSSRVKTYPEPSMSNSRGGNTTSKKDVVEYTIKQKVPDWATSMSTWVDLEGVLEYTVGADEVEVTCNSETVGSANVSIDGQRLTVTINDAADYNGKTIKIVYKAKVIPDANLDPYLNNAGNIASVPYQAFTSFNGEEKVVSSTKEAVKFSLGSSDSSSGTSKSSSTPKTGDIVAFAVPVVLVIAAIAAVAVAIAIRRRSRG